VNLRDRLADECGRQFECVAVVGRLACVGVDLRPRHDRRPLVLSLLVHVGLRPTLLDLFDVEVALAEECRGHVGRREAAVLLPGDEDFEAALGCLAASLDPLLPGEHCDHVRRRRHRLAVLVGVLEVQLHQRREVPDAN
jgi:hypothetical protein